MKVARLSSLVRQNLGRNLRHFVLSAFGITVGIAAFVFFLGLSGGVRKVVLGDIFPIDRIEVVAPKTTLTGVRKALTDDLVHELRARPEVTSALPKMLMRFGAKGYAELLGAQMALELGGFVDGIPAELVAGEHDGKFKDWGAAEEGKRAACGPGGSCPAERYCDTIDMTCHRRIPILASRTVLEMYNGSFAPAHGLPPIGAAQEALLSGQMDRVKLSMTLGDSYVASARGRLEARPRVVQGQLVGISSRAKKMGMTIPIGYVKRWNTQYLGEDAAKNYSSIVVTAKDKEAVGPLVSWVRAQGFETEDSHAETFSWAILIVTTLFLFIALLIVLLSAVNIAHTFFMLISERRREIGILRAVGATRRDISLVVLSEAAVMGLVSGIVGVVLGVAVGRVVDWVSSSFLPAFPFKPETYFSFPWWLVATALAFAMASCVMGAVFPAMRAARMQPAAALAA